MSVDGHRKLSVGGVVSRVGVVGLAERVEAAFEAVARAVDGEHFGVVEEAVEDRGGEGFVAEGVGPFGDGLVGGDDRRAAGVAAVDDLKDAVGVGAIERQVAGFVEDQQVRALQLRELAGSLPSASAWRRPRTRSSSVL